jgi:hypothetical protein
MCHFKDEKSENLLFTHTKLRRGRDEIFAKLGGGGALLLSEAKVVT